jgi:UDP-3-O-[3-hydroxymyristoyl] glucosamine N-acyltransferase
MATTVRQLAEIVQGQLTGDGNLEIAAARPILEAVAGHITFIEDQKHAHFLHGCKATAVVVPPGLKVPVGMTTITVADPLIAFVAIVRRLQGRAEAAPHGIDMRAFVHPSVRIGGAPSIHAFASVGEGTVLGARCRIHPGAVIGAYCRLGDDVTIYPNAVLYDGTVVGHRTIIHSGAVIGADGFGYRLHDGKHVKVPQLGHVELGHDVEIGAGTTVDRGTFGATRIGDGTKIDNLVQVAHNCSIGRHNLFVSQMGIAGSSTTGDYVVIAGQVGIVGHIHIGDRAMIGAKAGVTKDVPSGERMLGAPATPEREQKRILMTLEKLPEIRRDIRMIKHHLGLDDDAAEKKAG